MYTMRRGGLCLPATLLALLAVSVAADDPPPARDLGPRYRAWWESAQCVAFAARAPEPMGAFTNPAMYRVGQGRTSVPVTGTGYERRLIDLVPGTWPYAPVEEHIAYLDLGRVPAATQAVKIVWRPAGAVVSLPMRASTAVRCLQVDSVGYEPTDAAKAGMMGGWRGTAGALEFGGHTDVFYVVSGPSGSNVYQGIPALLAANDPESGARVYGLDFSAVAVPGRYRLHVPGVGWSVPFVIGSDAHAPVRRALLRALYHQRCGTAIGPPYTEHAHAACHTAPAKLVTFYHSLDAAMKELPGKVATPEQLIDGRGGWHDAGDYDRAGWHIFVVTSLLDAYTLCPGLFDDATGIPESGNGVPDILDEVRWGLAWFARMQDPDDGGLFYRIETVDYGYRMPEDDDQQLYAMAKYPKYTCFYSAGAAQAARVLEPFISSNEYAELIGRARAAYAYARAHDAPREAVSRAAAELFLTTGAQEYQRAFLASGVTSSWNYAVSPRADLDAAAREACRAAVRAQGDRCIGQMEAHAYPCCERVGARAGMDAAQCVRAAVVSGRDEYLDAARTLVHAQLGLNALRRSWVTGIGVDPPEEVTHAPSLRTRKTVPGLPIFGPQRSEGPPRATHARVMWEVATPQPYPWMRLYAPVWEIPGVSEFTVRDIAETLVAYAGIADVDLGTTVRATGGDMPVRVPAAPKMIK
jgi:endoglucanase